MTDIEQTTSPTEEEMSRAKSMLDAMWSRVSNTVVEASKLTTEVRELRDELGRLKEESKEALRALQEQVDKQTRQNQWLDEQLTNVRQQRDQAQRERDEERSKHRETERSLHAARHDAEISAGRIVTLEESFARAEKERDDAQLRVMELEESLKVANDQLSKVRAAIGLTLSEVPSKGTEAVAETPTAGNMEAQPQPSEEGQGPTTEYGQSQHVTDLRGY